MVGNRKRQPPDDDKSTYLVGLPQLDDELLDLLDLNDLGVPIFSADRQRIAAEIEHIKTLIRINRPSPSYGTN